MRQVVTSRNLTVKPAVKSLFRAPVGTILKTFCLKCASVSSSLESQPVVWSSHVSRNSNLNDAIEEAVSNALSAALVSSSLLAIGSSDTPNSVGQHEADVQADVALVFCSSTFHEQYEEVIEQLIKAVPSLRKIVGCSGFGVIGGAQSSAEEVEDEPGLSITLAHFPGVRDNHLI
jgi:deleted-in-malignant-brain-tumors protein 1